ncbi:SH3KBP1-binding protein 1 [Geodia barretti]|uniref:SH3KBP1-binding protein 1 n=1 Tax=Geodia barretti TaxID=519541 RepID=A0AA35X5W6_GEOBA|nr:SH3KBP1-binding protein 1 [Geodia barretti]
MAIPTSGPPSSSDIVRLNVGGEVFATTYGTLASAGESFFTSLLSGRHKNTTDDSGALFIDRSPRYFSPLLHFLRSGVLEIPPGVSHTSLQREAEFYGLSSVVAYFKQQEEEKRKRETKNTAPFMKGVGCYVDEANVRALLFTSDKHLTLVVGEQAFTQAMVIQNHPQVPQEWKADTMYERSFAIFYNGHVQKGSYKMNAEGRGMVVTLPGSSGAANRHHLATLSPDSTSLCLTSFSCEGGSVKFDHQFCDHKNPHHFHLFKLQKF